MFYRLAVSIAVSLLTSLFATPTYAQHIVVAREVLLEAAHPNIIGRAPDGGYVIAGYQGLSAWATKVDANGAVLWRHALLGSEANRGGGETQYRGIAFLRDGTVLLCGSQDLSIPGTGIHNRRLDQTIVGLLTRIGEHGELVSTKALWPSKPKNEEIPRKSVSYFDKCAATREGALIVGGGLRDKEPSSPESGLRFYWLLRMSENGEIAWQELPSLSVQVRIRDLLMLPGGDFVTVGDDHEAFRFGGDGKVKATGRIEVPIMEVSGMKEPIRVINEEGVTKLITLDAELKIATIHDGEPSDLRRRIVYALPGNALALFGDSDIYGGTPAVEWFTTDGIQGEMHVFMPTHGAIEIGGVARTSQPNEFATVRMLTPGYRHHNGPNEQRSGVLLSFIRFQ